MNSFYENLFERRDRKKMFLSLMAWNNCEFMIYAYACVIKCGPSNIHNLSSAIFERNKRKWLINGNFFTLISRSSLKIWISLISCVKEVPSSISYSHSNCSYYRWMDDIRKRRKIRLSDARRRETKLNLLLPHCWIQREGNKGNDKNTS